jgi:CheY-like chemotaxis protein
MKTDADLLTIPVVVLTSSRSPKDIQRCYSLHANAYVTKPRDFDGMSEVIRRITACFLDLIELAD